MDQLPTAIVNPGLSNDSLYALELDTKLRFENMRFQQPMALPSIPDPATPRSEQDDLTNNPPISVGQGLFSKDPKVSSLANQYLQRELDKRVTKTGVGTPEFFSYDKSMDKYLSNSAGYNPYVSQAANEEYYYQNQWMEKSGAGKVLATIGKGLSRFAGGVALKTAQTFGYLGSMIGNGIEELIDGKNNNAMADIADNALSRWAEDLETDMKNSNLLSVFKPKDWEDKGFFSKLGHGAFWSDEVSDGAAFMGEMILSTYMLGGVGKLAGLSKIGATSIRSGVKALDVGTRALTGAKDIAGVGRWAFMTASESAMESSGKYKDIKEKLSLDRRHGKNDYTDEEIRTKAGNAAASSFKDNMMILAISNAFENRMIFEPLLGKASKDAIRGGTLRKIIGISDDTSSLDTLAKASRNQYKYSTKLGKFSDWKNPNSRLRFYGSKSIKAIGFEGYWEENAQLATERLSANEYYQNGGFGERKGKLFSQALLQIKNATLGRDPEASTSIGLGAIIGVGGVTIASKIGRERRGIEDAAASVIKDLNEKRMKFLDFQDIYEKDADDNVLLDEYGDPKISHEKAIGLLEGIHKFSSKLDDISSIEDPLFKKYLQDDALADYVLAAKSAGVFGRVTDTFTKLGTLNKDQLIKLGFDPNTVTDATWMNNSINEIGKIYEEEFGSDEIGSKDELSKRFILYKDRVRIESAKKLAQEYQTSIMADNFAFIMPGVTTTNTSDIQQHNTLSFQLMMLENFEKGTEGLPGFYNEHITNEKARLSAEIAALEPLLAARKESKEIINLGDSNVLVNAKKYGRMNEKEASDTISVEMSGVKKFAEMNNIIAQYNYRYNRIKHDKGAFATFKEYNDAISKKDEDVPPSPPDELDPIDTSVKTPPTGKFYAQGLDIVNPEGSIIRTADTQEEADSIIADMNAELERAAAEKKKEEEEKVTAETDKQLRLRVLANPQAATFEELEKIVKKLLSKEFKIDESNITPSAVAQFVATTSMVDNEGDPVFTEEENNVIAEYIKRYNESLGKGDQQPPEAPPTQTEGDPIDPVQPPSPPQPPVTPAPPTPPAPPQPPAGTTEPIKKDEPVDILPTSLLDEVREAFRLHEQALLNQTSFTEEARKENLAIHNNRIDEKVNNSKNEGGISFVTSNPRELKKSGALITEDSDVYELRHNFMNKLGSQILSKDDFRLLLQVSAKGHIYAVVADKDGKILYFDKDANVGQGGLHLQFFLDTDTYNGKNLALRRGDVVKFGPIAPLTATPVILHPSFTVAGNPREDVLDVLKERIKKGKVTASIDFVLQGLLMRTGQDNEFGTIPKTPATTSAASLIEKGHIQSMEGDIITTDMVINGIYRRANRIHFSLFRDIANPEMGTEAVEFVPAPLGDVVIHDGSKLFDMTVEIDGKEVNFFEAAVKGELPATLENVSFLKTILRPDMYLTLNLGNTVMVIDLKGFKKFMTSDNINVNELRALTTVEDLKKAPLNIFKGFYSSSPVSLGIDILNEGDYMSFINNNVRTSAETVKRAQNSEGYARFNKRMVVTLNETFDDMTKKENQDSVTNNAPNVTGVGIGEELTEKDKLAIINTGKDTSPDEIEDDLTNVECK